MSTATTIRKEVTVNASAEKAFRVFTADFNAWWPSSHHISKVELKEAVIEPKQGGRWYERGVDDSECEWGRVLTWDPPHRLVLAWQLTANYEYDPNFETEVEVTFEAKGPNTTLVVLQHKYLDRYGENQEKVVKSVGNEDGGWGGIMNLYAAKANENAAAFDDATRKLVATME